MRRKSVLSICVCLCINVMSGHRTWRMGLAFEFEREVVSEVTAFVVATEEEQGVWIPDFQRP